MKCLWPSGLRRRLKAAVLRSVGSNPTGHIFFFVFCSGVRGFRSLSFPLLFRSALGSVVPPKRHREVTFSFGVHIASCTCLISCCISMIRALQFFSGVVFALLFVSSTLCEQTTSTFTSSSTPVSPSTSDDKAPTETSPAAEVDYAKLPLKELRKLLKERNVECVGCVEKEHVVERVRYGYIWQMSRILACIDTPHL